MRADPAARKSTEAKSHMVLKTPVVFSGAIDPLTHSARVAEHLLNKGWGGPAVKPPPPQPRWGGNKYARRSWSLGNRKSNRIGGS